MVCLGASTNVTGKRRSLRVVARFLSTMPSFTPMQLMNDNKQVAGFNMRSQFDRFEVFRPQLDTLVKLYESGQLKPHIDRSFSFEQVDAAHHWLHDRKARGKILLQT